MVRWRRLCVDVDETGRVIGASAELYDDRTLGPNTVLVSSRGEHSEKSPVEMVTYLLDEYLWLQPELPLEPY